MKPTDINSKVREHSDLIYGIHQQLNGISNRLNQQYTTIEDHYNQYVEFYNENFPYLEHKIINHILFNEARFKKLEQKVDMIMNHLGLPPLPNDQPIQQPSLKPKLSKQLAPRLEPFQAPPPLPYDPKLAPKKKGKFKSYFPDDDLYKTP